MTIDKQTAKFVARIAENLPTNMSDGVMQGWIDSPKELQKFLRGLCPSRLRLVGTADIPVRDEPFDPEKFFRIRKGLHVWDDFNRILSSAASSVESTLEARLAMFDLGKALNDAEIQTELPDNYVFEDAGIFCAYLAGMIDRQENGEEREDGLLVNGYANIFYVRGKNGEVFAVVVSWFSDDRGWFVAARPLVGARWGAGYRVFSSPATADTRSASP